MADNQRSPHRSEEHLALGPPPPYHSRRAGSPGQLEEEGDKGGREGKMTNCCNYIAEDYVTTAGSQMLTPSDVLGDVAFMCT